MLNFLIKTVCCKSLKFYSVLQTEFRDPPQSVSCREIHFLLRSEIAEIIKVVQPL